jgi:hypothetical protein
MLDQQERVHLCLEEQNLKIIDRVKKENHFSSRSKAINFIIEQFDKITSDKAMDPKELNKEIKKLKFAVNSTNKDTKMLLELINGIYYKEDYGPIPCSEVSPSRAYVMSKDRVENKIEKEHYRKSNTLD